MQRLLLIIAAVFGAAPAWAENVLIRPRPDVVFDTVANHTLVVMTEKKSYVERVTEPDQVPVFLASGATLQKIGASFVTGKPCTVYEMAAGSRKSQVCLADDGVMLRAVSGEPGNQQTLEAIKVTYAPQTATMFDPRPDYQDADVPEIKHKPSDFGTMFPPRGSYWGSATGR